MTVRFINQRASAAPGDRPHGAACDAESCTTPHSGASPPRPPQCVGVQTPNPKRDRDHHICAPLLRTHRHRHSAASPRLTCHLPPLQCNSSRLIVGHRRSIHPSTPANVPCAVLSPGETVKLPGAVQLCGGRCRGRGGDRGFSGGKEGGRRCAAVRMDGAKDRTKRVNDPIPNMICALVILFRRLDWDGLVIRSCACSLGSIILKFNSKWPFALDGCMQRDTE